AGPPESSAAARDRRGEPRLPVRGPRPSGPRPSEAGRGPGGRRARSGLARAGRLGPVERRAAAADPGHDARGRAGNPRARRADGGARPALVAPRGRPAGGPILRGRVEDHRGHASPRTRLAVRGLGQVRPMAIALVRLVVQLWLLGLVLGWVFTTN